MALRSVNEMDSESVLSIPLDIRGWEVRTSLDDENVGKVHDVLVDDGDAARYLDVDLGIFRKHVLLPVGQAATDEKSDVIWVHAMKSDDFEKIPKYEHDAAAVDATFERHVTTTYDEGTRTRRYHRPEYGGMDVGRMGSRAGGTAAIDPTVIGTEQVRLRRLGELDDYEVAEHDPDPRGWEVRGSAGEKIGEVDELVVDPQAKKARYLDVELESDLAGDGNGDHVLIPVGYARIDDTARRVRVEALSAADAKTVPHFSGEFDGAYEEQIERHFAQSFTDETRYRHPRFDADRLYGNRSAQSPRGTSGTPADRICDIRLRR